MISTDWHRSKEIDCHHGQSGRPCYLSQSAHFGEPGEGGQLGQDQREDDGDGGDGGDQTDGKNGSSPLPTFKCHKAHVGSHKAATEGCLW